MSDEGRVSRLRGSRNVPLFSRHRSFGVAAATGAIALAALPALVRIAGADDTTGFSWDPMNRTAVVAGFARYYLPSEDFAASDGWEGDIDSCVADSVSDEFLADTLRRINWYRAQAGVPADITSDPVLDAKCQQAALIMANQGGLSHSPTVDFPSNPCLTVDGNLAASKSNLSLGNYGPGSIDALMRDGGSNNSAAGHRRWTLYPRQQTMGNGAIPPTDEHFSAHVQYVFAPFKPAPPASAVPWPNEGFIPWQGVPDATATPTRWSFGYAGANFSSASVSVERLGPGGGSLPVTKETVANGYGDNTLVWRVSGIPDARPDQDTTYRVVISGVSGASQSTFTYDVTVIDPYDLGIDLLPDGPTHPPIGSTSLYGFSGLDEADFYDVRVSRAAIGDWTEGAEDAPEPRIVDGTSAGYALREASVRATGSKSFHLTVPSFEENSQSFTIDRQIVPTAGSLLRFDQLRRCVSEPSKLEAQISRDGNSWETLWSRGGKNSSPCSAVNDWDASFQHVEVAIPEEYAGTSIGVRFLFSVGSPAYLSTSTSAGFFVDDVSVTDAEELVDSVVTSLAAGATGFELEPADAQELWLQVRAGIGEVTYAWSTPLVVEPGGLICGDANHDGKLSAADALIALKTGVGSASCDLSACDANGSSTVSAADALLILKAAVGTPVSMQCPAA